MCCNIVCCFGVLSLCGCKDIVVRSLVFCPPEPRSYEVRPLNSSRQSGNRQEKPSENHSLLGSNGQLNRGRKTISSSRKNVFWLRMIDGRLGFPVYEDDVTFYYLRTRRNKVIGCCMAWSCRPRCTILFAHGNATDLGLMREQIMAIRTELGVNVFAFDYTGYGISNSKPTVKDTYADVEAAYDFMTKQLGISPNRIVGYGQSLGTGVIAHLAVNRKLRGLVLHSPMMSGLRVVQDIRRTMWFDIYPVIDLIKLIKIPVWILHGTADQEVPISHGEGVYAVCPNPWAHWFVIGGHHNNLEDWDEYYHRFNAFLEHLGFTKSSRTTQ